MHCQFNQRWHSSTLDQLIKLTLHAAALGFQYLFACKWYQTLLIGFWMNCTRLVSNLYPCTPEIPSLNSCEFHNDDLERGGAKPILAHVYALFQRLDSIKMSLQFQAKHCKMLLSAGLQITVTGAKACHEYYNVVPKLGQSSRG